jgi:hypothetical protein
MREIGRCFMRRLMGALDGFEVERNEYGLMDDG